MRSFSKVSTGLKALYVLVFFVLFSCTRKIVIVYDISQERFERQTKKQFGKFLIVDSREEAEYLSGHILDALNYPLSTIKERLVEISDYKTVPVYVYANKLDESFKAAKILCENGFKVVYNCEGLNERTYQLSRYHPIRLKTGFSLAKEKNFQLVDYRTPPSQEKHAVESANFVPYPNLDKIINSINFSNGYVIFSSNITHARECAKEFLSYGFVNVYYCIDNILDYPEYLAKPKLHKKAKND